MGSLVDSLQMPAIWPVHPFIPLSSPYARLSPQRTGRQEDRKHFIDAQMTF